MTGTVLKSTGSWYEVRMENGAVRNCRMKGKIRLEGIKETNPVAVGDYVEVEEEGTNGVINEILSRKNHLLRQAVKKSSHSHILAANIDQALLVVTLKQPRTSLGFIDRFIISAEAYRIPQIIIFNKADLLSDEGKEETEELISLYRSLGIHSISLSAISDTINEIQKLLNGKITLMAGHSGVGKSTLLNKIAPSLHRATGTISDFSQKGTHTTTFAEMFELDPSTFIIDTPGVKEWGLVDMTPQEISDYFVEMREVRLGCKFGSKCLHLQEPGCAIHAAVERGSISESRFASYVSMVTGEDNRK
ncbi:MAG: ribosome small subunit-dependent GTPase A [Cyclobacteriaceae bacterium]|nr:ribosome small subunit-dependent GTPase A [Cyclobacteriaceae bacterium]